MFPERDNDGAYAALTTEDNVISMATQLAESSNANDAANHLGTLTKEEREHTKAHQPSNKPPSSKALKRQRYKQRRQARRAEEAAMDVDSTTIDDNNTNLPRPSTPTIAQPTSIPPPTPTISTDPTQQRPQPPSQIVDGQAIPLADWRRAKKAHQRASKADTREQNFQQQRQTARREDDAATRDDEGRMELDPDGDHVFPLTHTGANDDDDNSAATGEAGLETRDGECRTSSILAAAIWKAEEKRRHYVMMEAKRAKRERRRFFRGQRNDMTAEEKQADYRKRMKVQSEAQKQMRIAAAKRKALAKAEVSKAEKAGGRVVDRKRRGRDEEEEEGEEEGRGGEDLGWEVEGLGFKRLKIWEG